MTEQELVNIFIKNINIPHFGKKTSDDDLYPYLKYCVDNSLKSDDYLFMELGVFTGNTFSMIRSSLAESIKLYGFDTFTGLPEDWMIDDTNILYTKGTFAIDYVPNNSHNSEFIVGRVEDTLNDFLLQHNQKISLIHFDMDLYNPIFFALNKIQNQIINGSILVFDDFYNMPGWMNHSFKALLDFINTNNIKFEPLCTVGWEDGWASAAIKILK